jgi:peptidoglycan/LPS O-acetylase OafA/YrhL
MAPAAVPVLFQGGRLVALDWLRALAILLVLAAHAPLPPPGANGHLLCFCWNRIGWTGVDLFFVLSGFLLTSLLLRERDRYGRIDAWGYLRRRAFKIYPPLALFLTVLVIWRGCAKEGSLAEKLAVVWAEVWPALIHMQNYWTVPSAGHLWSLAVEEQFYLVLLIALLVCTGRRACWLPRLLVGLLVAASAARGIKVIQGVVPSGALGVIASTLYRIDAVAAGALTGW